MFLKVFDPDPTQPHYFDLNHFPWDPTRSKTDGFQSRSKCGDCWKKSSPSLNKYSIGIQKCPVYLAVGYNPKLVPAHETPVVSLHEIIYREIQ